MKICLVRHGQAQVAPGRRRDSSLSPLGHTQAGHLAKWLADGARLDGDTALTVGSVVTSPLTPARETAEYVCEPLGLAARVQHTLMAADFPLAPELPSSAAPFTRRRGRLLSERYLDFRAQARTALVELTRCARESGQPVLAVADGGLIATVVRAAAESDAFCLKPYHCGITALEWSHGHWRLSHVNLWDHLPVPLRTS
ncbi:histidine phosphatase family protein [Streptomyces malaysiense]|uniref:Phosphoglycerate mutase n=1 Tax=Streptomyces malaysiense TaxID=1428626 RepID=A0A1J4Q444_9ACTN|nr:histidine phosphatase family protein [Streptomyces malaysiense]OIK26864.1 phosphoglycerate mutase [Streptomyces malaysiense]